MLHICAEKFDVTENLEFFFSFQGELNKAIVLNNGIYSTTSSSDFFFLTIYLFIFQSRD